MTDQVFINRFKAPAVPEAEAAGHVDGAHSRSFARAEGRHLTVPESVSSGLERMLLKGGQI